MSIFDEFDKAYDSKSMKEEIKNLPDTKKTDFEEIPEGLYQAYITDMNLVASKSNQPMMKVVFKIEEGNFKNRLMFMNVLLTKPFLIHKANEFLRSLKTGVDVNFESYGAYADVIKAVFDVTNDKEMDFDVRYTVNQKGFSEYKIEQVYEAE